MYLRKNKVKTRTGCHRYLSIAHNIWVSDGQGFGQSRPVVLANLGAEQEIEIGIARHVVASLERSIPIQRNRRGSNHEELLRIAERVRAIQPFLRALVRCRDDQSEEIQPQVLDRLIRGQLDENKAEDTSCGVLAVKVVERPSPESTQVHKLGDLSI